MEITKKLKAIRLSEGLSRDDFGQLVDIPRGTIRNYEQGVNDPKSETLAKITMHPRFEKYVLWLMTNNTNPEFGQVCPDFSILLSCGLIEDEAVKQG